MQKMMKMSTTVRNMCGGIMAKHGFEESEIMAGIVQIQAHSLKDVQMSHQVQLLTQAFAGNIPSASSIDEVMGGMDSTEEEAEICD